MLSSVYVDLAASGLTHDGTSWATAFVDLQQGLAAAVSGDNILVAKGTYKPTSGSDRAASFQLKSGVAIHGGYAGAGSADPAVRNVSANPTILSGDIVDRIRRRLQRHAAAQARRVDAQAHATLPRR